MFSQADFLSALQLCRKQKGAEDDRYLWPEMLRAIREIQPTWVVAENVVGITTMVQPSSVTEMGRSDFLFEESVVCREEYRYILDAICEDIEREGYEVQPLVPACATGAPHRRNRIWIVATVQTQGLKRCNKKGISAPAPPPYAYSCGGDQVTTKLNSKSQMGMGLTALAMNGKLPSPKKVAEETGGSQGSRQFNPLYAEEMMGFPSMWTTLPFLKENGERNP